MNLLWNVFNFLYKWSLRRLNSKELVSLTFCHFEGSSRTFSLGGIANVLLIPVKLFHSLDWWNPWWQKKKKKVTSNICFQQRKWEEIKEEPSPTPNHKIHFKPCSFGLGLLSELSLSIQLYHLHGFLQAEVFPKDCHFISALPRVSCFWICQP